VTSLDDGTGSSSTRRATRSSNNESSSSEKIVVVETKELSKSSKEKVAPVQASAKVLVTQSSKQSLPTAVAIPVAIVSQESLISAVTTTTATTTVEQPVTADNVSRSNLEDTIIPIEIVEAPKRMRRSLPLVVKNTDPAKCLDQIDRMYNIYYEMEDKYSPKPYMNIQKEITIRMRSILIDWLVEVHHNFKLHPSTLWLCVNVLDRYLERVPTTKTQLQLVGVSALFIACKYEEIYPPEVRDCVHITDNAYDREEVLKMEGDILKELNYQICVPTCYHFLTRYLNCIQASERTQLLASYYAERNLQEYDMLLNSPHLFAAAAIYAAIKQQNQEIPRLSYTSSWSKCIQEESGLEESDLIPCARVIIKHVGEEPETSSKRRLIAAKKKYAIEKYHCISNLPLPSI
jgi:cyclin B